MRSDTMELADGRTLSWAELGADSAATVLLANHGTGSSRLEMAIFDALLRERDVRVIAPERPGYGRSTPCEHGRSLGDWATDVGALVAALDIASFVVSGYSGGGPHALAIAASPTLNTRVSRVLLSASSPLAWMIPLSEQDQQLAQQVRTQPWGQFESSFQSTVMGEVTGFLSPADQEAFADPTYLEAAMATIGEGARQGPRGEAGDAWAWNSDPGFDLEAVTQPVEIWHGDADLVVPVEAAYALQRSLAQATLHILAGDGHFSIGAHLPEQLDALGIVAPTSSA